MNGQNNNGRPPKKKQNNMSGLLFLALWTFGAIAAGAPWWFWMFGVFGLITTIHSMWVEHKKRKNGNGYNQYDPYGQYSQYGSYGSMEKEPDPWDKNFRSDNQEFNIDQNCGHIHPVYDGTTNFCPYCGSRTESDFNFCKTCGRQLPD